MCETGLLRVKALSQPGSVEVGTMALDRKVRGNRTMTVKEVTAWAEEKTVPSSRKVQAIAQAQPAAAPAKKKMSKGKIAAIVVGVLFVFGVIGSIGGNGQTTATTTNDKPTTAEQAAPAEQQAATEDNAQEPATETKAETVAPKAETKPTEPQATTSQKNALKKAKSYLNYSAFSYSGLIEQLEFEGFSTEDATYGADNCGADWMVQAEKKAKKYLDYSSFSHAGLVEQLEFEGFTPEQAEHGATSQGL